MIETLREFAVDGAEERAAADDDCKDIGDFGGASADFGDRGCGCEREGDAAPPRIAADDTASNWAGKSDDDADADGSGGIEAESRPIANWR